MSQNIDTGCPMGAVEHTTILGLYMQVRMILISMSRAEKPRRETSTYTVLAMVRGKLRSVPRKTTVVIGGEEYVRLKAELEDTIAKLREMGEPVVDGRLDDERMHEAVSLYKWKQLGTPRMVTVDARNRVYMDAEEWYSDLFLKGYRAPARREH